MERIEACPLYWPSGWPRTETRQPARFRAGRKNASRWSYGATISAARENLFNELNLMGMDDWDVILFPPHAWGWTAYKEGSLDLNSMDCF